MVGQIGGLARIRSDVNDAAAQLARVWTAGWAAKDKSAIEKSLAEITAASAANQKVYDEAAAALKELSAREKAFREEQSKTQASLAQQAQGIAEAGAKLAAEERALDEKRRATEAELAGREAAVTVREAAAKEAEKAAKAAAADAENAVRKALADATAAAKAQESASRLQADTERKVAETRRIWSL